MTDMFRRASPGDPIAGIPSETYNGLLDMLKDFYRRKSMSKAGPAVVPTETDLQIQNASGAVRNQYSIVAMGARLVGAHATDAFFFGDTVFASASPQAALPFAILQEPARNTFIVPARVAGLSFVKVNLTSLAHTWAAPVNADYDKLLSSATTTSCEILAIDNGAATTLAAGIGSGDSTLTVTSSAAFPATPFVVTIGSEDLNVTSVSGVWSVTRGYNGTTPSSHANNAAVTFKSGVVWALVRLSNTATAGGGDIWSTSQDGILTASTTSQVGIGSKWIDFGDSAFSGWFVEDSTAAEGGWGAGVLGSSFGGFGTPRGGLYLFGNAGTLEGEFGVVVGYVMENPLIGTGQGYLEISTRFGAPSGIAFRQWGESVFATTTANFTIPAQGVTVTVTVDSTASLTAGMTIGLGNPSAKKLVYGTVTSITDATHFVLTVDETQRGQTSDTMPSGTPIQSFSLHRGQHDLTGSATGGLKFFGGVYMGGTLSVSLTSGVTGTLTVSNGGSGATTFTAHGILLGEGTSTIIATAAMTDGQILTGQTGADPLPKTMGGDATFLASGLLTIVNDAVSYAKMQNISAASKLLGRGAGAGAGDPQEITLGTGLSMSGTTLNVGGAVTTLADGGTGSNLSDPAANSLWGWDDTDNSIGFWTIGSGLSYDHATHTLSATGAVTFTASTSAASGGSDGDGWIQWGVLGGVAQGLVSYKVSGSWTNIGYIVPGGGISATYFLGVGGSSEPQWQSPDTFTYNATTPGDWNGGAPTTVQTALDRCAALLKTLNGGTGP